MNIQNVSKNESKATVELSVDDLVIICNALYPQLTENKSKENFLLLYSNMMMVRDLCQYDHVDNFCLHNIVKCRNSVGEGLNDIMLSRIKRVEVMGRLFACTASLEEAKRNANKLIDDIRHHNVQEVFEVCNPDHTIGVNHP